MLDSLVRVSRRVAWNHYASILGKTADLGLASRMTPRVITLRGATFPRPFSDKQSRCWPDPAQVHPAEARLITQGQGLIPSGSLSTISRTVSLSFQSTFHLSITLLVSYRSLANI